MRYVRSGHLVYAAAGGENWPFNLSSLEPAGRRFQIPDVVMTDNGAVDAVISDDGTRICAGAWGEPRTLV
jgi:hypothetical protein